MLDSTTDLSERALSILVVDDEEPVREVVTWMLQDAGHDVHSACDGLEALDFLSDHGPVDVVLSDINMPGLDGMELCSRVRERWPELPVILVSGRPPPRGARPFIAKPFRWDTLVRAIACSTGGSWQAQPAGG
jgi:CheY-like chemotaxis protein